jgi:iron(III)-salmochelin esterase
MNNFISKKDSKFFFFLGLAFYLFSGLYGCTRDSVEVKELYGYTREAKLLVFYEDNQSYYVSLMLPEGYTTNDLYYPLVLAFGGRGESLRDKREGAQAWIKYYYLDEAVQSLSNPPLSLDEFNQFIDAASLNVINSQLEHHPYKGLIIANPYSPDILENQDLTEAGYEEFIMERLLPYLKSHYRIQSQAIGIDGVSLGAARSMYFGLKYPEVFTTVGSIQGALNPWISLYTQIIQNNQTILANHPPIQLITSSGDYLRLSTIQMKEALTSFHIQINYYDFKGPHDYIFNRGPGALMLLIYHNHYLYQQD